MYLDPVTSIPKSRLLSPGVDPGFPTGGGAKPSRGMPTYNFAKFSKNCMKLRKFGGGGTLGVPPRSANDLINIHNPVPKDIVICGSSVSSMLVKDTNSTIHKATVQPAAIENNLWRSFLPVAPNDSQWTLFCSTGIIRGTAVNRETTGFVSSAVKRCDLCRVYITPRQRA